MDLPLVRPMSCRVPMRETIRHGTAQQLHQEVVSFGLLQENIHRSHIHLPLAAEDHVVRACNDQVCVCVVQLMTCHAGSEDSSKELAV